MTDTAQERRALAERLTQAGVLVSSPWRAAVEAAPSELFLNPGVFLPPAGPWSTSFHPVLMPTRRRHGRHGSGPVSRAAAQARETRITRYSGRWAVLYGTLDRTPRSTGWPCSTFSSVTV